MSSLAALKQLQSEAFLTSNREQDQDIWKYVVMIES
jgi:hypothetical protein